MTVSPPATRHPRFDRSPLPWLPLTRGCDRSPLLWLPLTRGCDRSPRLRPSAHPVLPARQAAAEAAAEELRQDELASHRGMI